jgi:tetratricopeptide (TPR) repeat protein
LDAGHLEDALALYGGDLLPGMFVSDAPQFEQWLEDERSRLRRRATDAAWRLARQYAANGDTARAERMAYRAASLTPDDEGALCQLLGVLEQVGNFTAALRAYHQFAESHVNEYGVPPTAETRSLVQRIRTQLAASDATPLRAAPVAVEPPSAVEAADPAPVRSSRKRRTVLAAVCAASIVIMALLGTIAARRSAGDARMVAATEASARLYALGERAASQSDDNSAARFFLAALAEDSTSALAAYHAALSESSYDKWAAQRDFTRAWRLAAHASPHDALTIRQSFASFTNDRRALALAESLVTKFPAEAEAELALGRSLDWSGDFLAAASHLRRAISIDSAGRANPDAPGAPCWACQAYHLLVTTYRSADSLGAADRAGHAWVAAYPTDPLAWFTLAMIEEEEEHGDSALIVGRRGNAVTQRLDEAIRRARIAIRVGAFADADRVLAERIRDGTPGDRLEALWWLITSLRTQGRLREALAASEQWRASTAGPNTPERYAINGTPASLPAAQVEFEAGRYAEAAAAFDSIRVSGRTEPQTTFFDSPGLVARHETWMATHVVAARAAAGDTSGLAALADSIARWGSIEGFGRDQRLHFYAVGELLAARGDTAGAIDALRRSIYSPTSGYTRAEFDAARLLLASGRAREAIAMLQPALRGGLDASNWYVTRTELHELLARAFTVVGARDSAALHYAYVATAWRQGDPPFRARANTAATFLH